MYQFSAVIEIHSVAQCSYLGISSFLRIQNSVIAIINALSSCF